MRPNADIRRAGFTLVEVLVALVIVSLGMLAVIQAVSETARNGTYLRDKTLAHWIAMNQLTSMRLAPTPPKIDKSSDDIEMGDRRWRWTMEVTQTAVESVRRIDVSVRPEDADEESSMASVTGFYGTAIAKPGANVVLWQRSGSELRGGVGGGGGDDDDQGDGKKDTRPPPQPPPPQPDPGIDDPPPEPPEPQ